LLYTEAIEQWQKHVTGMRPVSAGVIVRLFVPADLLSDLYGNKKGRKADSEAISLRGRPFRPFFVTVVGDARLEFNRHGGLKTRFIRPSTLAF